MRKDERFNNILNECLDRIFKGETVEQCLRAYPEQAKELEPLLRTASVARIAASVQPRPEFKAEARRRFQASLIGMKVQQNERRAHSGNRRHWQWHSAWAISLVAVVIVVMGGASTVAASNGSMPGSRLYPVKLAAERVQLALTPGEMARTELNAKFADRRTEEIIYAASKGNAQEVQIVASRLNVNLSNITELAADNAHPGSKPAVEPATLKAPQAAVPSEKAPQPLKGPVAALPPEAKPDLPPAAAPPARARSAAPPAAPLAAALAAQSPENAATQDVKGLSSEKDVVTHSAKYEAMKKIVQDNFEKRSQKLEETLKNASPAVRPAIRQAIAQSDLEYERTLKNLEETDKSDNAGNSDNSNNSKEPTKNPGRQPKAD